MHKDGAAVAGLGGFDLEMGVGEGLFGEALVDADGNGHNMAKSGEGMGRGGAQFLQQRRK